jgi:hypothetical protein
MSDTPRTDSLRACLRAQVSDCFLHDYIIGEYEKLERELAAALKWKTMSAKLATALLAIHQDTDMNRAFLYRPGEPIDSDIELAEAYQESKLCETVCVALSEFDQMKTK